MKLIKLAQKIQKEFPRFYLAGGTAIMLRHKHRESKDLDYFNQHTFSFRHIYKKLTEGHKIQRYEEFPDNIDFFIQNIKVSFVFFPFANIERIEKFQGIRIASDYDLLLNKIYVAGRRIDPRDIFDLAYLYKIHRWDPRKIEQDFEKKFPGQSYKLFLGAILSFEDYGKIDAWIIQTLEQLKP